MPRDKHVERLIDKLLRAIEVSLSASDAAREAMEEILRRGAEAGDLSRGDGSSGASDGTPPAGSDSALTDLDREFLKSIAISPENR